MVVNIKNGLHMMNKELLFYRHMVGESCAFGITMF